MITFFFILMKMMEDQGHEIDKNHIYGAIVLGLSFDVWFAYQISKYLKTII